MQPFAPHESLPIACGAMAACALAVAVLFGRSPARRAASWAIAFGSLAIPFVAPPTPPIVRFLLALFSFLLVIRVHELVQDRRDHDVGARLWFLVTPFDTRKAVRVPPKVRPGLLVGAIVWPLVTASAFWAASYTPFSHEPRALALRWGLGLVASYGMADAAAHLVQQGYLAAGVRIPVMHRAPILSRTVAEFWGERWNLEVNRILRQQLFVPLARRRMPTAAFAAGFAGSMVVHVWIMIPPGGFLLAGVWCVYFALQGVLVIVERAIGVPRWRTPIKRAWTIGLFVVTAPLFVEPLLRITVG